MGRWWLVRVGGRAPDFGVTCKRHRARRIVTSLVQIGGHEGEDVRCYLYRLTYLFCMASPHYRGGGAAYASLTTHLRLSAFHFTPLHTASRLGVCGDPSRTYKHLSADGRHAAEDGRKRRAEHCCSGEETRQRRIKAERREKARVGYGRTWHLRRVRLFCLASSLLCLLFILSLRRPTTIWRISR